MYGRIYVNPHIWIEQAGTYTFSNFFCKWCVCNLARTRTRKCENPIEENSARIMHEPARFWVWIFANFATLVEGWRRPIVNLDKVGSGAVIVFNHPNKLTVTVYRKRDSAQRCSTVGAEAQGVFEPNKVPFCAGRSCPRAYTNPYLEPDGHWLEHKPLYVK